MVQGELWHLCCIRLFVLLDTSGVYGELGSQFFFGDAEVAKQPVVYLKSSRVRFLHPWQHKHVFSVSVRVLV